MSLWVGWHDDATDRDFWLLPSLWTRLNGDARGCLLPESGLVVRGAVGTASVSQLPGSLPATRSTDPFQSSKAVLVSFTRLEL